MIQITNNNVYGLETSMATSGYPMSTDLPKQGLAFNQNDITRAGVLAGTAIGEGHDNFLNGIIVQFDLTAPIKVWTEAQRYHFLEFVSSQSTMHRLFKMNLNSDKAFDEHVTNQTRLHLNQLQEEYNRLVEEQADKSEIEEAYLKLLMNCPVGLNLTARMTTNYRQLKTIYHQRKNHRLPHWHDICKWIESLPFHNLITGSSNE